MSYGVSFRIVPARCYLDKNLKAKTSRSTVEQLQKFELWINLKTANQIGLTIPPNYWRERIG